MILVKLLLGMRERALDDLADLLTKDHPEIVIELRSHTDIRGSKQLNKVI